MQNIKPGDFVTILSQGTVGEVIAVKGNDLEIALGLMKVTVKKNKVAPALAPKEDDSRLSSYHDQGSRGIDTKEKLMRFKFELDVRGKSKEEVMAELAEWVDDALLLGIKEATVVHGRGNGILKDTVRATLRKYKEIGNLSDAVLEKGGEGTTVVKFKE